MDVYVLSVYGTSGTGLAPVVEFIEFRILLKALILWLHRRAFFIVPAE